MTEQPRQEFDLRYPARTQPDGGPCWCMSADAPHEGWVHSPLCNEMFRRWWRGDEGVRNRTPHLRAALEELHQTVKEHRCSTEDLTGQARWPINECGPDCYVDRALAREPAE